VWINRANFNNDPRVCRRPDDIYYRYVHTCGSWIFPCLSLLPPLVHSYSGLYLDHHNVHHRALQTRIATNHCNQHIYLIPELTTLRFSLCDYSSLHVDPPFQRVPFFSILFFDVYQLSTYYTYRYISVGSALVASDGVICIVFSKISRLGSLFVFFLFFEMPTLTGASINFGD